VVVSRVALRPVFIVVKKRFSMNNTYEYHEKNMSKRQVEIGFDDTVDVPIMLLKQKVIRPVLHRMIFLTIVQLALLLILLVTSITDILSRDHYVVILFYAFPTKMTLALSWLLWRRQIWAIRVTLVLSFLPLLYGILILSLLPAARFEEGETMIEITYFFVTALFRLTYAPVVILSCILALDHYRTLMADISKPMTTLKWE